MCWENLSFIKFGKNNGYFTRRPPRPIWLKRCTQISNSTFHTPNALGEICSRGLHMMLVSVSFAKLGISIAIIMVI